MRLRAGALLLLCVAIAGCLGAVQLLPTAELLRESVRQDGLPFALAADDSFDPSALSGFAFPRPALPGNAETGARMSGEVPWLLSAYMGVAIAWLAALGLLGPRRRWAVFWCAVAAAGALLALGRHSPVFGVVYELVPPFRSLRYPEKFLLLAAFAFPALAAAGMERVLGVGFRRRDVALGLAIVAGSALASVRLVHDAARPEAAHALAMAAAVGTGVAGVLLLAHRRKLAPARAGVLLCALAAADLALAARAVNPSVPWSFYRDPWAAEVLRRQAGDPRAFRVRSTPLAADMNQYAGVPQARIFSNHYLFHHSLAPNLGQLYGFLQQDGMAGIETLGTADLIDALLAQSDLRVQLRLLRLLGVGYLVTSFPLPAEDVAHVATHDELPIGVVRMRQPLPRAYLAREWSIAPDARRALEQALEPGFALGEAVVLDRVPGFDSGSTERPPASAASSRSAGAGRVRKAVWGDASAELEVDLPGPALLVLTDSYYPGWTAEVDGASAPVLRANGYQRAVAVDAGRHAVGLRYRPASLELGAWISAGTLLLLAVGLLTGRRRGDPTSRTARPQEPSSVTGRAGAPSAGERARDPLEPEFPSRLPSPVGS
ncbi:MAG: hypothetical protein ABR599_10235 [Gemmatimonadota bacterium]